MLRRPVAARIVVLVLTLGGSPASLALAEAPPLSAAPRARGPAIVWSPPGGLTAGTLTVADPQGRVRTFRFTDAPTLPLFDAQGLPLVDGVYSWELRGVVPTGEEVPERPFVQSGSFTLADGAIVPPGLPEPAERRGLSKDQMVPDDLIVDGKGCIGLGCAANEAFATEALRLKQSVVRLRFEDTSAQAGFPARDWQLSANDSASGGADRFSIEDLTAGTTPLTIRGGAPTHSIYVDAQGRVGLGTATPAAPLNAVGSYAGDASIWVRNTSPTGFSGISFYNHANTNGFFFGLDNARSETRLNSVASFPFVVFTNNTERIRIQPGGNIGLGCTDPGSRLVIGAGGASTCATAPFSSINPGSSTFTTSSSRAFKKNLAPVEVPDILQRVSGVGVYTYDFIDGPEDRLGLVAEDFHHVFGRGSNQLIQGGEVEMALWLAVQRLTRDKENLEARLAEVEAQLQTLLRAKR